MRSNPTCQHTPTRGYQGTVLIHGSLGTGAFSNSPALYLQFNVPPDPHGSTSPCSWHGIGDPIPLPLTDLANRLDRLKNKAEVRQKLNQVLIDAYEGSALSTILRVLVWCLAFQFWVGLYLNRALRYHHCSPQELLVDFLPFRTAFSLSVRSLFPSSLCLSFCCLLILIFSSCSGPASQTVPKSLRPSRSSRKIVFGRSVFWIRLLVYLVSWVLSWLPVLTCLCEGHFVADAIDWTALQRVALTRSGLLSLDSPDRVQQSLPRWLIPPGAPLCRVSDPPLLYTAPSKLSFRPMRTRQVPAGDVETLRFFNSLAYASRTCFSGDETQVWLGDLRVVLLCGVVFVFGCWRSICLMILANWARRTFGSLALPDCTAKAPLLE